MADKLGITVEFRGQTTDFEKAVKKINSEIRTTKSEISTVNKELKLDPKNIDALNKKFELLQQKSKLLTEQVQNYQKALNEMPEDAVGTKEWEQLNRELQKAQAELNLVNNELKNMPTANVQVLSQNLEEVGNRLSKVGDRIENVGKKFMAITTAVTGLATAGVMYNAELERQTTLFTNLTGSAEKAEQVLNAIKQDSLGSPFDTQSLITANQYLMSTGIEAEKSRETILALGDAISATGGGNSELQRMAQNLQQIQNVGKASSMDMKQFAMAGIDIWGALSKSTGKTIKELQEMDITFDMINEALIQASSEGGQYYGAMSSQTDTFNGKIAMLKATFQELLGELTQQLMPVIKRVIDRMQEWINKIRNLDDSQKKTISKIAGMVASIGPLLTIIGRLIGSKGIGGLMTKLSSFVKGEEFTGWLSKVTGGVGLASGSITSFVTTILKTVAPIGLLVAALINAYTKNEDFRKAVNNLVNTLLKSLKPAFDNIIAIVKVVISAFTNIFNYVSNTLAPIFTFLINNAITPLIKIIGDLATKITNVLNVAFEVLDGVIKIVIDWFTKLGNNIKEFFKPIVEQLKKDIDNLVGVFKLVVTWLQNMFDKFKNTTFGNAFMGVLDTIGSKIGNLIQGFKSMISEIDEATRKTQNLSAEQQNAQRYSARQNTRAVVYDDNGVGSGGLGIGMTVNIHVDNNGTPIDTTEIQRWVSVMANQIDMELGRSI